jgi:ABC-type lipoprotein release transport system permease subunit
VLRIVLGKGLAVTLAGLLCGFALVLALERSIAGISFTNSAMGAKANLLGGSAIDPLIYAASAVFLCVVAFLACWNPARRAASINPTDALRAE